MPSASPPHSSAIPLDLALVDLDRYGKSTEATVYFCVTETLERARMSGASNARVEVADLNGNLITTIDIGFVETELDMRAVADRLDASGGTLTIEDRPGQRRCIVISLPLVDLEGMPS